MLGPIAIGVGTVPLGTLVVLGADEALALDLRGPIEDRYEDCENGLRPKFDHVFQNQFFHATTLVVHVSSP